MYVGRFAPSPSGPLHLGSLVTALASYIDAKAHSGLWLLRIEDLDTPRCHPHYSQLIIDTLRAHGMQSDKPVMYQSEYLLCYQQKVKDLLSTQSAYYCQCSRKQIREQGGVYLNTCRNMQHQSGAVRFVNTDPIKNLDDRIKGPVSINEAHALEDFILLRRDNIYAYNLAVVVDDIRQGVTHIVRGDDLLTTTSAHLSLYRHLNSPAPLYAHVPVVKDASGQKLSKQNHAPAIEIPNAIENLLFACKALDISLPVISTLTIRNLTPEHLLKHAVEAWRKKHMLVDNQNIK